MMYSISPWPREYEYTPFLFIYCKPSDALQRIADFARGKETLIAVWMMHEAADAGHVNVNVNVNANARTIQTKLWRDSENVCS